MAIIISLVLFLLFVFFSFFIPNSKELKQSIKTSNHKGTLLLILFFIILLVGIGICGSML